MSDRGRLFKKKSGVGTSCLGEREQQPAPRLWVLETCRVVFECVGSGGVDPVMVEVVDGGYKKRRGYEGGVLGDAKPESQHEPGESANTQRALAHLVMNSSSNG